MTTTTATTGRASARRVVGCGTRGGTGVVYDPLTGLTHRTGQPVLTGRTALAHEGITALPEVPPDELGDGTPVSVCWSPIVRCNLACPQCLDDKSGPELGRGERAEVAARIATSGVLGVDVSGGEPLLIRELPTLLDVLVDGGCAVSVTTNGTHLPRRAEALGSRVDAIRVSLDGPDPQRHDRWRGEGSFAKAVSGIRAALAYGIPTQIQTVLMRSTATGLPALVELADRLGVHGVTVLQYLPIGAGAKLDAAERVPDDKARDLIAALVPTPVPVRLRTRADAAGFTVVRADGQVWPNTATTTAIAALHPLAFTDSLAPTGRDYSA
ncbi:Radical SAM superfamily protein [Actinokineospora alba]|uniref:Radical SAM superfamily protein n=1 Tax=Actinokineospora alba TaxID=504798 RepID=A0A1H0LAN0_9PSEU|nr:radical SAM protein [Actinokineospora alba]TDP67255.1 radical SAM family protein [Actinokineospora alba]SDJ02556.1 Radical SAM superfamily protein [Actinokineospora alba]SDO65248.1 Radical SAM superfamily protein [Actinokineospora alba]